MMIGVRHVEAHTTRRSTGNETVHPAPQLLKERAFNPLKILLVAMW